MDKFENGIYRILCAMCGLLILFMTVLIFIQVLCRYAFDNSLTWSEELGRYVFVWIAFLGLPAALKAKAHVALDLLLKKIKGKSYQTVISINAGLTLALSVIITVSGFKLVFLGMGQNSSALMISMPIVYSIIPVSGLLMLFFTVRIYLRERHDIEAR